MRLFFLRHGIAEDSDLWQGEDSERPLTDQGKELIASEAKVLAELDLGIDAILSSPFLRAYQTAEIVARELKAQDILASSELLGPGLDSRRLEELLSSHAEAEAPLLVGHEPDFSRTIGAVIGGGKVRCKKGSLVCVKLDGRSPPRGELLWSLPPSFLAGQHGD
jgi:phosphohistidine phosphatase